MGSTYFAIPKVQQHAWPHIQFTKQITFIIHHMTQINLCLMDDKPSANLAILISLSYVGHDVVLHVQKDIWAGPHLVGYLSLVVRLVDYTTTPMS